MDRVNRTHARFPSDLEVEVFTGPVGGVRIGAGVLLDVSLGGCLLRFAGSLKTGATYRLRCAWQEGILDLPGRVARAAGVSGKDPKARRYGLAFNLTYDQEKALRRLIDFVQRTRKPGPEGFMRGYWG